VLVLVPLSGADAPPRATSTVLGSPEPRGAREPQEAARRGEMVRKMIRTRPLLGPY